MKNLKTLPILISLLFIAGSCKKVEEPVVDTTPKDGAINIVFNNMVGSENLMMNQMSYTNAAGNLYSASLLKYYVSNIQLHKKGADYVSLSNYELIDASDLESCKINGRVINHGEYDSIVFYIGIDKDRNHNGNQDGDLDVSKGMFWTWNTGYIFFKHEGTFKNSSDQNKSLIYHYATDAAFAKVALPIQLNINGDKTLHLKFDLNQLYQSPNQIDFNVYNNQQSTTSGDAPWIAALKSNFANSFSFIKSE